MRTAIHTPNATNPSLKSANPVQQIMAYQYDQLNRIMTTRHLDLANAYQTTAKYNENYSYDPNGNILTLDRTNGQAQSFDQLVYKYDQLNSTTLRNNQLKQVLDSPVNTTVASNDIENQTDPNNYVYDEIGNLIIDKSENITNIVWSIYGKVLKVEKQTVLKTTVIEYLYDATGNRVRKNVKINNTGTSTITKNISTYYYRDAQGNVLNTVSTGTERDLNNNDQVINTTEFSIYGSSRLGAYKPNVTPMSALDGIGNGRLTLGFKTYELSNHLGNVLTTISDNVIIEATLAKQARVLSSQDYYPFGMAMTERSYQESQETKYRYGFNGKEYENDISEGVYNFEARMMDSRICRFTSTDPLAAKYPNISSYVFVANCPLIFIDIDGKDIIGVTRQDARKFKADIHLVLADKKFEAVRALIDLNGAKFKYIDATALSTAIGGITNLSEDEKAYIDVVTNTINNVKEVHKIEYLTEATTSTEGAEAFRNHMNSVDTEAKLGDKMLVDGELKTDLVKGVGGEGLNVPTSNGSHSFITTNAEGKERSVTSGHEVFGHGIPSARKLGSSESNGNAIRADNLIRRLFKMTQRDGRNHSGYNDGHITNQEKLPITK